jgi:hypothetical protein
MRTIDFTKTRTLREKQELFSQTRILLARAIGEWNRETQGQYPKNLRPEQNRRKNTRF